MPACRSPSASTRAPSVTTSRSAGSESVDHGPPPRGRAIRPGRDPITALGRRAGREGPGAGARAAGRRKGRATRMKIDTGIGANLSRSIGARPRGRTGGTRLSMGGGDHQRPLPLARRSRRSTRSGWPSVRPSPLHSARNPMSLAYTTNQLQEFSRGRLVLGLGSQVRAHIQRRFSCGVVSTSRPHARVRPGACVPCGGRGTMAPRSTFRESFTPTP
jgi:hypothetical protein